MKYKQKLKIGDRVKIKLGNKYNYKAIEFLGQKCTIKSLKPLTCNCPDGDWWYFSKEELQLITPKKKSKEVKQEYKKEHLVHSCNDKCDGYLCPCDCHKSPSLLNELETIEEIEGMAIQTDGIQPEQVSNNDYFADLIGKLIKNQRILTEVIKSLLIK